MRLKELDIDLTPLPGHVLWKNGGWHFRKLNNGEAISPYQLLIETGVPIAFGYAPLSSTLAAGGTRSSKLSVLPRVCAITSGGMTVSIALNTTSRFNHWIDEGEFFELHFPLHSRSDGTIVTLPDFGLNREVLPSVSTT